tara:strand:- start:230 stop:829 length:600 start_codon:yes stop_codon:yes gene_type:complete
VNAFETYKAYMAIRNHFSMKSYDYFKYNGKTRANYNSFLKRKDKIFFAKLGKTKGKVLTDYLVSNFVVNSKIGWIGELLSEQSEKTYVEWKRKVESLSYLIDDETSFMNDWTQEEFNNYFTIDNRSDTHPPIVISFLQKNISLETIVCINSLLSFFNQYDKVFTDPIYEEVRDLCKKYEPFLKFEKNKISKIIEKKIKK